MLKSYIHKCALDRLENMIDPGHVRATEQLHADIWKGKPLPYVPCIIDMAVPDDWPHYPFIEAWEDAEKNLMNSLGGIYCGALIKDDRLYQIRPEYGVVNIPETLGIPSIITNQGNSMSEGFNNTEKVRELIKRGPPDFNDTHSKKVEEFEHFTREALKPYDRLSQAVHLTLPDTQGPFDLACLVWGSQIFLALYDEQELVGELMNFVTEAFIRYNMRHKHLTGEPVDSAYHICGLKLVRGGVRICDDSATLVSIEMYNRLIKPYNLRAFAPFDGGWLHYCGNGNHLLDEMLDMEPLHYLHLGNPDMHDFLDVVKRTTAAGKVLFWSGALEKIQEAFELAGRSRLLVLAENRYQAKDLPDARKRLEHVRAGQTIARAKW
ncbi:MAG: hypothetical protein ABIH24_11370 [Verrucomicrobiota bacterium]